MLSNDKLQINAKSHGKNKPHYYTHLGGGMEPHQSDLPPKIMLF